MLAPGWYPGVGTPHTTPASVLRWWDGSDWTEHVLPLDSADLDAPTAPLVLPPTKGS